ncbi:MAG TPA: hypothetical protein VE011_11280 [Candidatus Dormibacteraeota bacterium]|nr:hypothetical protein [Candidatus Dormibacteraeota bacterium]
MIKLGLGRLTRNTDAPWLIESFFVVAVASFLGIRWFLAITGYPQLGANGLHIAHMLWGGLLLVVAVLLLVAFLDRSVVYLAAMVAGLGFGTFIDEIGKFVTADNNYFYRPAVALVYASFVVVFLVARAFVGRRQISRREAISNALHQLATFANGPIEPDDRARITRLLSLADPKSERTRLAMEYLADLPSTAERHSIIERAREQLAQAYEALMENPLADRALTVGVVVYAVLAVAGVGLVALAGGGSGSQSDASTGAVAIQVGSTIAGAGLVARGVISLPTSRIAAYRWFIRGTLVWILITQVFVFYSSQLAGLGGLVIDLVAYGSLRFAIIREMVAGRDQPRQVPTEAHP